MPILGDYKYNANSIMVFGLSSDRQSPDTSAEVSKSCDVTVSDEYVDS